MAQGVRLPQMSPANMSVALGSPKQDSELANIRLENNQSTIDASLPTPRDTVQQSTSRVDLNQDSIAEAYALHQSSVMTGGNSIEQQTVCTTTTLA